MAEMQDSWKEVSSKAEALGLKLKLHLEQEHDASEPREAGDTKALVDDLTTKLTDAFDSIGNAAKDKAVHDDVKDVGRLLRDALVSTFHAAGAEVSNRTGGSTSSTDDDETPQDASPAELDEVSGDESDGSDA
jgi:hypothetical protein